MNTKIADQRDLEELTRQGKRKQHIEDYGLIQKTFDIKPEEHILFFISW